MIIRLARGDEIVGKLLEYCSEKNIESAWISGIGAISEAELALYNLGKKEYSKKSFSGAFEIVSLSGNIGRMDKKFIAHLHMVISDENFTAFGGHLNKAVVAATCEINLLPLDDEIIRKYDEEIGLNLIKK